MRTMAHGVRGSCCLFPVVLLYLASAANGFRPSMDKAVSFSSADGSMAAYDKAMPEWLTKVAESSFLAGRRWLYQHPDQLANESSGGAGNLDWTAPVSSEFFLKSKLWIVFQRVVEDFTGRNDYVPYKVEGVMLRRGDFPSLVEGEIGSEDITCRLFLSKGNSSNSEMVFFDRNGELIQGAKKKFSRLLVWNASLSYIMKQPGFQTFKTEYSLLVKMSRNAEKMKNELNFVQAVRESEKRQAEESFPTFNEKCPDYDHDFFERHLTRKFYDKDGYVIGMFDGIMSESELAVLRRYLIKQNTAYSNSGFSTDEKSDADNVSWIAMFTPDVINNTKILNIIKGMANYLSGEDDWYPYDVSLNMVQKTFHTRIHEDCEVYEHEYTFLLYLNPNWTADMYGETIFLNQIQDMKLSKKKVLKDKAYETIVSVRPKYGRMVMFRNIIPHSARPPSPDFHGTRYTFAVKMSRNKVIGLSKILRELLEFKKDAGDGGAKLFSLISKMESEENISLPIDTLRESIEKYRKLKNEDRIKDESGILVNLLRKVHVGDNQPGI